ncbi:unnamed protein product [Calypogeia fissa]
MRFPSSFSRLMLLMILGVSSVHGGGGALLDACTTNADCGVGLYCATCAFAGATVPRCIRDEATALTTISSLPYNKVSWLTTHNSYAIVGAPLLTGARITFENQEDSVTSQLNNGVRALMLDTYDFLNDVWLCHSFGGVCYNFTSFEPLLNTLIEIQTFLAANPTEIVTIFLEDYVTAPNGLTNVFKAANLTQYWFPVASMPVGGAAWPTIGTMIQNNWRLLVFTSIRSKQATEGIAYQWAYMNENQYGSAGMVPGSCPNRAESQFMNNTGVSLILQNFFRDDPIELDSCKDNSADVYQQLPVCYAASGDRWANFLAVDFYKQSTGGGSFQAVDKLNGQQECGCNSPVSCQNQKAAGVCPNDPTLAEFSSTFVPTNSTSQGAALTPTAAGTTTTSQGRLTTSPVTTSSTPAPAPVGAAHCNTVGRTSLGFIVGLALCLLSWASHLPL